MFNTSLGLYLEGCWGVINLLSFDKEYILYPTADDNRSHLVQLCIETAFVEASPRFAVRDRVGASTLPSSYSSIG